MSPHGDGPQPGARATTRGVYPGLGASFCVGVLLSGLVACKGPGDVDSTPACVEVCTSALSLTLPDARESFLVQLTAEGWDTQVLSCPEEWINGTVHTLDCAPGALTLTLEGQRFPAAIHGSLDGGPSTALALTWAEPAEVCDTTCADGSAPIW